MGIFDFLRKGSTPPPAGPALDKKVAGPAKVVADKRAQTYDRIEAIQALVDMKSPDAAPALLKRFTFAIDPSITDQEEKDLAFQGIVAAGSEHGDLPKDAKEREKALAEVAKRREKVVEAVLKFCERAEVLTWPLKVLHALLEDDDYRAELLALLEAQDTEYARNVEPKIQLLSALEEVMNDDAREAVERFLEDVNETVKFHAVQAILAAGKAASIPALVKVMVEDESVRIRNKIADGLILRGWAVPEDKRDAAREAFSDTGQYALGADGKVTKR